MAEYELSVEDSGIGMTKEFADQIFEAFTRERTSTVSGIQGTGLGMAISKSIIDAMGGSIEVESEPGRGTKMIVNVRFPLSNETDETESADSTGGAAEVKGARLLLVEDMEINRQIAHMLLENEGYKIDMAENGKEAVEMLEKASAGAYDAVLMDVQMPVMDGYEATEVIRNMEDPIISRIPVIAVTANAFEEDIQKALEAGMDAHVAKPIDAKQITEVLQALIGNEK